MDGAAWPLITGRGNRWPPFGHGDSLIGLAELGPQLSSSGFSPWPAITWLGDLEPCDFTALGTPPPPPPNLRELLVTHSLRKNSVHLLCAKHDSKWRLTAVTREDKTSPLAELIGLQIMTQIPFLLCPQLSGAPSSLVVKARVLSLAHMALNLPRFPPYPHCLPLSLLLTPLQLQPRRPLLSSSDPQAFPASGPSHGCALCLKGSPSRHHPAPSRPQFRYHFLTQAAVPSRKLPDIHSLTLL